MGALLAYSSRFFALFQRFKLHFLQPHLLAEKELARALQTFLRTCQWAANCRNK